MSDPVLYQIRISPRCRNVYLRMSLEKGLEVVVPRNYPLSKIPELIVAKRSWIEKVRLRFEKRRAETPLEAVQDHLPSEIDLIALGQKFRVEYVPLASKKVTLHEIGIDLLRLSGNVESQLACRRLLQRWLVKKGSQTLSPWLKQVSDEVGLPFQKASVRLQQSRWGSCSRRATISLNAKLLFLGPELVRYLFIHELCHLVHMNHSRRYWDFVGKKEPGYKQLDRSMRTAMRTVPRWCR